MNYQQKKVDSKLNKCYNQLEFKEKGVGKMKNLNFKQNIFNKLIVAQDWSGKFGFFPTH